MATRPLYQRKLDMLYFVFFLVHIPIMLVVDLVPLYPQAINTALPFLADLRFWYVKNYKDLFFTSPPAWFSLYIWLEAIYHLPLSLWALRALLHDSPRLPHQLLAFAVETAVTTATCVADLCGWKGFAGKDKLGLLGVYGPYLAFSLLMMVDMFWRLEARAVEEEDRVREARRRKKA